VASESADRAEGTAVGGLRRRGVVGQGRKVAAVGSTARG
jgi:hypothetical protein